MKKKRLLWAVLISFLLSFAINFVHSNYGAIKSGILGYTHKNINYSTLASDSGNLVVEYRGIDSYVDYITLHFNFMEALKDINVYTMGEGEKDYADNGKGITLTKAKDNKYTFNLDTKDKINSIKVSIPTASDESAIGSLEINPQMTIKLPYMRTIIVTILIFLFYLLIFEDIKYWSINSLIKNRYYIATLIFVVLVIFKIHGSSIGMWDNFVIEKINNEDKSILFGEPRAIRSDEWLVQTPLYLSQEKNDDFFEIVNDNVRSDGQNSLVSYYSPALDITLLGKPFNWGFIFFSAEHAFSWYWCMKLILIFLFSIEMGLIITSNNKLAFLTAMLITFSAPIQWWFNTAVVDSTIFSFGIIISFWRYLTSEYSELTKRIINLIVFLICAIGFVISLYPPIQVPLGYLALIFMFYTVIKNKKSIQLKKRDWFMIGSAFLIFLLAIVSFLMNSMDAISMVFNTSYPGQRSIMGGSYDYKHLFSYLLVWLLPFKEISYLNSSEISGFTILLPEIIISVILLFITAKGKLERKGIIIMLSTYCLVLASYMFIRYPELVAKLTLFSFSSEPRMLLPLGIALCLLLPLLLQNITRNKINYLAAILSTGIILLGYYWIIVNSYIGEYFNKVEILITIITFGVLSLTFLRGKKNLFIFIMSIFMFITGAFVNPVAKGLGPLYNKTLSQKIIEINEEKPGTWAATDDRFIANFITAQGVKVFNGVHYYPDMDLWEELDPEGEFESIYNRYAHVILTLNPDDTVFKLLYQDTFEVSVSYEDFYKTGVDYIITRNDFSNIALDNGAFQKVYYSQVDGLFIFKFIK